MEIKELRLKLVDIILTNIKGLTPNIVIDVARQYEDYINSHIPDKAQAPGDSQKEGRRRGRPFKEEAPE